MKKIKTSTVVKGTVKANVKLAGKILFVGLVSAATSKEAMDIAWKAAKCLPSPVSKAVTIATGAATNLIVSKYLEDGILTDDEKEGKNIWIL